MSIDNQIFHDPPVEFRTVPFWSWNESLEEGELRRQIRLFQAAGCGGGFMHARVGLLTPYLGAEWFAACASTLDECHKTGLKGWLYDEDSWPSGFSGGTVPFADEAFRHKALFARPASAPVPNGSNPVGGPHDGLQVYCWTASLGEARFNGACYADLLSPQAMHYFVQEAYESYYRELRPHYGSAIPGEFTDEPCALLHYRIPAGAVPFTPSLFETFKELHGYDATPHLHLLFLNEPGAARFRLHYYRVISHLFEHNFTRQLAMACEERGIALTGHYYEENSLYEQQAAGNAIMPNYRHQQIPGIDHLFLQVTEIISAKACQSVVNQYGKPRMLCEMYGGCGQGMTFEDRLWIACHLIVMGVNLINTHMSLYSMAGSRKRDYPPNLFYQQPWFEENAAVELPLARLCAALSQGKYVAEALVLHPGESPAALWRVRSDWDEPSSLNATSQVTSPAVKAQIEGVQQDLDAVMRALLLAQRGFDLGDETILADVGECRLESGKAHLRVGEMEYKVVIVPTMVTIRAQTFRLLREFHAAGGTLLRCGTGPELIDGEPSRELGEFWQQVPCVEAGELPAHIGEVPCVEMVATDAEPSSIRCHVRDLPDGDRLVFLFDLRRTGEATRVVCRFSGDYTSIIRLNAFDGSEENLPAATKDEDSRLNLHLDFHPTQIHLLRLVAPANTSDRRVSGRTDEATAPASSSHFEIAPELWQVERLDDNALPLDTVYWREGEDAGFTGWPVPIIVVQQRLNDLRYTGPLILRYEFEAGALSSGRRVHLVVEYPERYRITVNGEEVAWDGLPFYRDIRWQPIDISHLVATGTNRVELHLGHFQFGDPTNHEDQTARYGTEIESVYIVGDFHVQSQWAADKPEFVTHSDPTETHSSGPLPPVRLSYVAANSTVLCDPVPLHPGNLTVQGLPFYAGRVRLTVNLNLFRRQYAKSHPARNTLELWLQQLDAVVAKVEVDGETVGHLVSQPYRVQLPSSGERVSLTLYSSLRNLLGPHHRIEGERFNVRPWDFIPFCGDLPGRPQNIIAWGRGSYEPDEYRASYACTSFGDLGEIALKETKPY